MMGLPTVTYMIWSTLPIKIKAIKKKKMSSVKIQNEISEYFSELELEANRRTETLISRLSKLYLNDNIPLIDKIHDLLSINA